MGGNTPYGSERPETNKEIIMLISRGYQPWWICGCAWLLVKLVLINGMSSQNESRACFTV